MKNGTVKVSDGAHIYYEVEGEGQPIVLIHGWGCSGRFYKQNVDGLKDKYQVVTIDMRGHGRSSKMLGTYTIDRMAQDIHEVAEALDLKHMMLMGWSMGGPTMLAYWKLFGNDNGRVAGLGLIDMTPYPFSDGAWNSHSLNHHNYEGFNKFQRALLTDQDAFLHAFEKNIFKDGKIPEKYAWMHDEMKKLPPYIGVALYCDYCYSDYTDVLPTITVPTLVVSADSGIFPHSVKQGTWIASQIPKGEFVPFEKGGHFLFGIEADKFNKAVDDFCQRNL
jgi:non-heme chloroperoxidase